MSERIDRRIGGSGSLMITAGVLVLAVAVLVFAWLRMTRQAAAPTPTATVQAETPAADEPLSMTIFVPSEGALSASLISVKRKADTQAQARVTLEGAFENLRGGGVPLFSQLELREFFVDQSGTAYVDLASVPENTARASSGEELLAVYAIVNTLLQNFEEIRQVRFLVDGREAGTLAGHIDLVRAFTHRTDLVRQ